MELLEKVLGNNNYALLETVLEVGINVRSAVDAHFGGPGSDWDSDLVDKMEGSAGLNVSLIAAAIIFDATSETYREQYEARPDTGYLWDDGDWPSTIIAFSDKLADLLLTNTDVFCAPHGGKEDQERKFETLVTGFAAEAIEQATGARLVT
ncbi:MAG: hypothetical protein V3R87_10115 [Dehalococcoidia bacterium]|nr:hypothetical protein [Gammaproteobacteria bacterium]